MKHLTKEDAQGIPYLAVSVAPDDPSGIAGATPEGCAERCCEGGLYWRAEPCDPAPPGEPEIDLYVRVGALCAAGSDGAGSPIATLQLITHLGRCWIVQNEPTDTVYVRCTLPPPEECPPLPPPTPPDPPKAYLPEGATTLEDAVQCANGDCAQRLCAKEFYLTTECPQGWVDVGSTGGLPPAVRITTATPWRDRFGGLVVTTLGGSRCVDFSRGYSADEIAGIALPYDNPALDQPSTRLASYFGTDCCNGGAPNPGGFGRLAGQFTCAQSGLSYRLIACQRYGIAKRATWIALFPGEESYIDPARYMIGGTGAFPQGTGEICASVFLNPRLPSPLLWCCGGDGHSVAVNYFSREEIFQPTFNASVSEVEFAGTVPRRRLACDGVTPLGPGGLVTGEQRVTSMGVTDTTGIGGRWDFTGGPLYPQMNLLSGTGAPLTANWGAGSGLIPEPLTCPFMAAPGYQNVQLSFSASCSTINASAAYNVFNTQGQLVRNWFAQVSLTVVGTSVCEGRCAEPAQPLTREGGTRSRRRRLVNPFANDAEGGAGGGVGCGGCGGAGGGVRVATPEEMAMLEQQ